MTKSSLNRRIDNLSGDQLRTFARDVVAGYYDLHWKEYDDPFDVDGIVNEADLVSTVYSAMNESGIIRPEDQALPPTGDDGGAAR